MNIRNNTSTNAFGAYLRKQKELFKPLTKAEEQSLINANRNQPEKLRKLLILHNVRLVFSLAKKYAATSMDFDELIGRGFEGLCIAAQKFDLNRNIKFNTYATPWVFKYIVKEYSDKDVNASKMGKSLDSCVRDSDGSSTTFANIINNYIDQTAMVPQASLSVSDQIDQKELHGLYEDVLKYVKDFPGFTDVDRTIFQRNILEKDSIREISSDLNLDYSFTNKRKKEIIGKIKQYLVGKYGEDIQGQFL